MRRTIICVGASALTTRGRSGPVVGRRKTRTATVEQIRFARRPSARINPALDSIIIIVRWCPMCRPAKAAILHRAALLRAPRVLPVPMAAYRGLPAA